MRPNVTLRQLTDRVRPDDRELMVVRKKIASGVKSYGQCLNDFFKELIRREVGGLLDSAGASRAIVASPSSTCLERLYDAAKAATNHPQAALDAQAGGTIGSLIVTGKLFSGEGFRETP